MTNEMLKKVEKHLCFHVLPDTIKQKYLFILSSKILKIDQQNGPDPNARPLQREDLVTLCCGRCFSYLVILSDPSQPQLVVQQHPNKTLDGVFSIVTHMYLYCVCTVCYS